MKQNSSGTRGRSLALVALHVTGATLATGIVVAIVLRLVWPGSLAEIPIVGTPAGTPTASVFEPIEDDELAPVVSMHIPALEVEAPVIEMGVDERNQMQVPDRPDVVAWYGFTSLPGEDGNAVFSAHVNWYTGEYAVFSALSDVARGDEVHLELEDGRVLRYRVASLDTVDAVTADADEIIAPTGEEMITLITCHGSFDRNLGQFQERLVVRATRVA